MRIILNSLESAYDFVSNYFAVVRLQKWSDDKFIREHLFTLLRLIESSTKVEIILRPGKDRKERK